MRFIDEVRLFVRAGDGGDGVVAWRREKFVPRGGPAGGDGGRGGDVVLVAAERLTTLLDLRHKRRVSAEHGRPGSGRDRYGRSGADCRIRVPVGTMVYLAGTRERGHGGLDGEDGTGVDADQTEHLIGDLTEDGQQLVVARGGVGGRGNIHFKSATNRAPEQSEPGQPGESAWLRLELKLLADVGIVGFPNVGKSTLVSRISRARPKIADYPFTTLVPQLGVVSLDRERSMVVAEVPGLIEGASEGRGLGHAFLRHLERTRVLLHLLAPDPTPGRTPLSDLDAIEAELAKWGHMFDGRPRLVALNKIDTLGSPEGVALLERTRSELAARNIPVFAISAHTGEGVPRLLEAIWRRLELSARRPE
jgi:GTP-binding protein